jgi:hypothetical protein
MAKRGEIEGIKLKAVVVPIVGDSPLLVHRFSEKAAAMMLGRHMGVATSGREKKVPELEFVRCLYLMGKAFGFPCVAFKSAAVRGADITETTANMREARMAFRVDGPGGLVQVFGTPVIDVVPAKNFNVMDVRIRPRFDEWGAFVPVTFNEKVLSHEQVFQMFQAGGFGCGLGDWRQERNGVNGAFRVGSRQEVEAIRKRHAASTAAFFREYGPYIDTVSNERSSLWKLIEMEQPEEQTHDEAKKLAKPRARRGNGAQVEA